MKRKKISVSIPKPVSIRDKVYNAVRKDVLNGRIAPGERIVEARVAREINTSRTPVREALHMLEREGLLEAIPRVGYRVKQIDLDEMEDLCEMRNINEALAARWAIDRISAKELDALENCVKKAEETVLNGEPELYVEYDSQFHEILAHASGSQRLFELCQILCRHMLRYRIEGLRNADTAMRSNLEHRKILNCIKNKDKEGVDSAVKKHLEWVKWDIKDKISDK